MKSIQYLVLAIGKYSDDEHTDTSEDFDCDTLEEAINIATSIKDDYKEVYIRKETYYEIKCDMK